MLFSSNFGGSDELDGMVTGCGESPLLRGGLMLESPLSGVVFLTSLRKQPFGDTMLQGCQLGLVL